MKLSNFRCLSASTAVLTSPLVAVSFIALKLLYFLTFSIAVSFFLAHRTLKYKDMVPNYNGIIALLA
ncbi:hypothetical protein Dfer_0016 [Dyadobacter fermentans DSM 18053]|uniref:Uncharacterized protein n=1 Tax=Dyadobacter fermentans (strain ATCC 700827 / DSM 18053 / CIP 107007 / KCTC 52180 / NS114) TaxID=471854 RepID=C6VUH9_DYAFD|nr:hypothetical protein Dfer_0016 [Dyadobacter fermentans DSM 18053]